MKQAILFAAGLGTRARPLTLRCPKPALRLGHVSLLARHLNRLENSGYERVLVTCSYQSSTLRLLASQRARRQMRIEYSHEGATPLETAGGVWRALPRMAPSPITLVSADVWTEFDFDMLSQHPPGGMHLVTVPNPIHHQSGDFVLSADGLLQMPETGDKNATYSGIAQIDWRCRDLSARSGRLAEVFRTLAGKRMLTGQMSKEAWFDVGDSTAFHSLNETLLR